jgi:D-alanine-D-alanine ligase
MKYVAYCAAVATPAYQLIKSIDELDAINMAYPLFVKPAKAGDSLGIDDKSLVHHQPEFEQQVANLLNEYDEVLIEEYIKGREFTVLVAASVDGKSCKAFTPVEFIFPAGNAYKTYALKTSELHPEANIPVTDIDLKQALCTAAQNIFTAFNGVGYARLDFRMNEAGELFFLEINFTCSVFYKDGYEGSADYILKYDTTGQAGFLKHIIEEGIARHQRKQKCYQVKGNAIAGYGIYATKNILAGEIIFKGEEKAQRIVTKQYVDANWNLQQKEDFDRYAYPISKNVFILWDEDATAWAPQNHSCNANTKYAGLNVVAGRDILKGEELTLDYALLLNDTAQGFQCSCKATNCRGNIRGAKDNSVESRLSNK